MIAGTQRIFNSSTIGPPPERQRRHHRRSSGSGGDDPAFGQGESPTDLKLGGNRIGTTGLMPSFIAFGHEHLRPDFEKIPGWRPTSQYPSDIRLNPARGGLVGSAASA